MYNITIKKINNNQIFILYYTYYIHNDFEYLKQIQSNATADLP